MRWKTTGPLEFREDGPKKRFLLLARALGRFITTPTAEELTELEYAARSLGKRAPVRAELLRSLRNKIRIRLDDKDRMRIDVDEEAQIRGEAFACQVGPRPLSDSSLLSALRGALLAGKVVRFDYGDDEDKAMR